MRTVEFARYYLPPPPGSKRKTPYPSSWKMSPEDAAALDLTAKDKVPFSGEPREVPETEEERRHAHVFYQSAGHDGAKPPRS